MYKNPTVIGEFIEEEARDVSHSPSSYAADWEVLRTKPGRYPLIATFGDLRDQPYYVGAKIDADRVDGKTYSGFAGLNFASSDLPRQPKPLHAQIYGYELARWVASGKAVVLPEYQKYVDSSSEFLAECEAKEAARRAAAEAHKSGLPHDTNPDVCNPCWAEARQNAWDLHQSGEPHDESICVGLHREAK